MDGDFYVQIKDYNKTASLLEVEACSYSKAAFDDIVSNAEMVSRNKLQTCIRTIYNMSDRVVSDIQSLAEGETLYVRYNTDANIVKYL